MVAKVNDINTKVPSTSELFSKTQHNSGKQDLEKIFLNVNWKKPNASGLVRKTDLNSKAIKIEDRIPSVTVLVNTADLNRKVTEAKNKISDITNLAVKAALNKNSAEIESKIPDTSHFFNTQEFNRLTKKSLETRIKDVVISFASKSQIYNALDVSDKNEKIT